MASSNVSDIPIFWGHGKNDPLVTYLKMGKASADFLVDELEVKRVEGTGVPIGLEFHGYEGVVHSASEEELDDLRTWLKRVVPKQD